MNRASVCCHQGFQSLPLQHGLFINYCLGDLKEMQVRHEVLTEKNEELKERLMESQDEAREAVDRVDDLQGTSWAGQSWLVADANTVD